MITLGNNIFEMERSGRGRLAKDVPHGNNFGAWLRAKRLECHLTGEALAFAIGGGMTQGRVSAYERGHKKPERETVVVIAQALGADPREALEALMADTPGMPPVTQEEADDPATLYREFMALHPEDRAYLRTMITRLSRSAAR
jgi:transcriptional regulator with XRE-family HTH domain